MTDVNQFLQFLKILGKENWYRLYIIPIRKRDKTPLVRKGESWLDKRIHLKEAVELLNKGYNIGLVGKPKGLLFVDVDNANLKLDLPETFTVSTNKGYHMYYLNTGIRNNLSVMKGIVSVRAYNQYVVGVGSTVYKTYKIVNPAPLSEIDFETIRGALDVLNREVSRKEISKGYAKQKVHGL